ncbi:MAG: hemolysin family protein, partial [Oscillospiraceae bacterium]
MGSTGWWMLAILGILISISAFFSASEMAFSSVNKMRLKTMADSGNRKAAKCLAIAEHFDKTLSVILVGNNVVNIAASSAATLACTNAFGASGVAIATLVMTVIILVFGEVLPKSIAKENTEKVAFGVCNLLSVFITLLTPIAFLFVKMQEGVSRLVGSDASQPLVTEQELLNIIEAIEDEGVIDEQKSDMVQSALTFDDTTVQEVLTPRVDLAAINLDDPPEKIRELILAERFSRMPVYEKTLDNIVGILQTRDYLEAALSANGSVELAPLLAKPLFVHKTQKISTLLSDFRRQRVHIAVVIDDYGGTMGVVSLEDLLEELVGEIWDEDEEAEIDFAELEPYVYRISGDCGVYEALERIGYEERDFDSEYSSLGGWALERLGRLPQSGDSFEYNGVLVTVDAM